MPRSVRFGEAAQVREGEELALEADAVLISGPEQPQHVDGLVPAAAAGREIYSHGRRLARRIRCGSGLPEAEGQAVLAVALLTYLNQTAEPAAQHGQFGELLFGLTELGRRCAEDVVSELRLSGAEQITYLAQREP
jgi:hypothetical protein